MKKGVLVLATLLTLNGGSSPGTGVGSEEPVDQPDRRIYSVVRSTSHKILFNQEPLVDIQPWSYYNHLINQVKDEWSTDFVILVNTATCRMIVDDQGKYTVYPVIVGKLRGRHNSKYDFRTPEFTTYAYAVVYDPWWYPPKKWWAPRTGPIPPGRSNPLGPVKILLKGTSIMIHGNNMRRFYRAHLSHGCIRMRNDDVKELGDEVRHALKQGRRVVVKTVYLPVEAEVLSLEIPILHVHVHRDVYRMKVDYEKVITTELATLLSDNSITYPLDITPLLSIKDRPGDYYFMMYRWFDTLKLQEIDDVEVLSNPNPVEKKLSGDRTVKDSVVTAKK